MLGNAKPHPVVRLGNPGKRTTHCIRVAEMMKSKQRIFLHHHRANNIVANCAELTSDALPYVYQLQGKQIPKATAV
jgi:hypothetical protein